MPSWNDIQNEIFSLINKASQAYDVVRRKYLDEYYKITQRNTILYYSGWLQKPGLNNLIINDNDKIGFMTAIKGLDKKKGLDLILHTPGGDIAATESLVDYLNLIFEKNIRVVVPQMALSAGTMIALSSKEIIMGKHSSLGPIDPQIGGIPAHGVLEEFKQAKKELSENPELASVWGHILSKYHPTFIGECHNAIEWAEEMVKQWLSDNMFSDDKDKEEKIKKITNTLGSHMETKAHNRHISIKQLQDLGLKILALESNEDLGLTKDKQNKLQDTVLSLHHATIATITNTRAYKIIENQNGEAFISQHD